MLRKCITRPAIAVKVATLIALAMVSAAPVVAQGWQWPWDNDEPRPAPRPSAPIYRDPPQYGAPSTATRRGNICLQLEQRLAQEANKGAHARSNMPEIEQGIREQSRTIRAGEAQLDRHRCFEYFLFAKSLRRTRRCVALNRKVEGAKRKLADFQAQRQQAFSSGNRSYRDDIIRELAQNNCGETYSREASRISNPFSSIWQDEGSDGYGGANRFGTLPFATYRTICVRLCDGYYFPVSFSTLPNHFDRDAEACQSKCAAPSELFYHQNPGAGIDQAVSHATKKNYTSLTTAFRYRKEYVPGCSCKSAEYIPSDKQPQQPLNKRADVPATKSWTTKRPGQSSSVQPPSLEYG